MGADFGHNYCTRAGQREGGCRDAAAGKLSRPAAAGHAQIGPTTANLGRRIFVFSGHFRTTHTSFPPFLDHLNSFLWSLLQIPHRLKVTTKTKLVDGWIEFFGHQRNCWTKVMVLMSSWSLGLSIDMWFVNFGRRLVSFPFLGCFG